MTGFEVGLYHDDPHGTALEIARRQVVSSADLGDEVPSTLDTICQIPDTTDVLG